jgi:hypothetical protein
MTSSAPSAPGFLARCTANPGGFLGELKDEAAARKGWIVAAIAATVLAGTVSYVYARKKGYRYTLRGGVDREGARSLPRTFGDALGEEVQFRLITEGLATPVLGRPAAAVFGNLAFGAAHEGSMSRKGEVVLHGLAYSGLFALGTMACGPLCGLASSTIVHGVHNKGVDHGVADAGRANPSIARQLPARRAVYAAKRR